MFASEESTESSEEGLCTSSELDMLAEKRARELHGLRSNTSIARYVRDDRLERRHRRETRLVESVMETLSAKSSGEVQAKVRPPPARRMPPTHLPPAALYGPAINTMCANKNKRTGYPCTNDGCIRILDSAATTDAWPSTRSDGPLGGGTLKTPTGKATPTLGRRQGGPLRQQIR